MRVGVSLLVVLLSSCSPGGERLPSGGHHEPLGGADATGGVGGHAGELDATGGAGGAGSGGPAGMGASAGDGGEAGQGGASTGGSGGRAVPPETCWDDYNDPTDGTTWCLVPGGSHEQVCPDAARPYAVGCWTHDGSEPTGPAGDCAQATDGSDGSAIWCCATGCVESCMYGCGGTPVLVMTCAEDTEPATPGGVCEPSTSWQNVWCCD